VLCVSSECPGTSRQMKALSLRPCAFICFSVFGCADEALALVLEIVLHKLKHFITILYKLKWFGLNSQELHVMQTVLIKNCKYHHGWKPPHNPNTAFCSNLVTEWLILLSFKMSCNMKSNACPCKNVVKRDASGKKGMLPNCKCLFK